MLTNKTESQISNRVPAELLLRHSVPAQGWQLATPQPTLRVWGMSPYRPTRREFLIGAGSLLVLAPYGCSGNGGQSGQGGETTASGTRTVEHALGTTEVPMEPQRVVALFSPAIEVAVEFGIEPIATDNDAPVYPYLVQRLDFDGVETVGRIGGLNLEAIAAADPDLVIGFDGWLEEVYDELSEIAPTVAVRFPESGSSEWREYGRKFAVALHGEEGQQRYNEMLSAYEQRAEEVGRRIQQARGENFTVAIMRSQTDSQRFELPNIFSGSVVYSDVGLPLPQGLRETAQQEDVLEVSLEELSRGDADVIFVYAGVGTDAREQSAAQIEALREEPVFRNLRAAESGNVYPAGAHWFSGNIIAAPLILDDLERYLLSGGSTTGGETS